MLAALLLVGLASACSAERQQPRWPGHRKIEEGRITTLEVQVASLQKRIADLEDLDRTLRGQILPGAPATVPAAAAPAPPTEPTDPIEPTEPR